jgi:hypothetical protein
MCTMCTSTLLVPLFDCAGKLTLNLEIYVILWGCDNKEILRLFRSLDEVYLFT